MAKQIIHGIGKAILRDFKAPKTVIGFADLQDLAVESTSSEEDITGGNKMFPIASFKTDEALTVSATNASFTADMLPYLNGATKTTGVKTMSGMLEVRIPEDGTVTLTDTPVADSVVVQGFTVGTTTPTAGQYVVTAETVKFATDDAGQLVTIVYEYSSSATGTEYATTQTSMTKPFIFDYLFDIYDEDSQISHKAMIKIYKAQCTSGFTLNAQHKAPFAPKFEAKAKDPQRVDGKLWGLFIDGIEVV